jgi:hypothetical protein
LNTTLIFVSLSSASTQLCVNLVFSGGIGRSVLRGHIRFHYRRSEQARTGLPRNELRSPQDYRQRALGNVPTGADAAFPQWNGPDPTIVHVQAILYSSLAASLLAAFIAMLGKQWLNRYAQVEMRGSVIDRSRDRQRKMDGMVTWHFDLVMECLPLMLQAALLLLGYALSEYLFFINKVVASVLIGFTTFGLLFYFLIVSAATLSYNCPFQTPLSLILRFLDSLRQRTQEVPQAIQEVVRARVFSRKKKRPGPKSGGPHGLGLGAFDQPALVITSSCLSNGPPDQPPPLQ